MLSCTICTRTPDGAVSFDSSHLRVLHALPSALLITAVVGAVLAVAGVALQRRDVT